MKAARETPRSAAARTPQSAAANEFLTEPKLVRQRESPLHKIGRCPRSKHETRYYCSDSSNEKRMNPSPRPLGTVTTGVCGRFLGRWGPSLRSGDRNDGAVAACGKGDREPGLGVTRTVPVCRVPSCGYMKLNGTVRVRPCPGPPPPFRVGSRASCDGAQRMSVGPRAALLRAGE